MCTKVGTVLILAGVVCIVLSAALIGYNLWDDHRAELARDEILNKMGETVGRMGDAATTEVSSADPGIMGRTVSGLDATSPSRVSADMEMPTVEIGEHEYLGRLDIPVLGLSLPVMDTWSYPNLRLSPCRYSGSAYSDDFIIVAYNYESHFGKLDSINVGDPVYFTDVKGNVFSYQVSGLEKLQPTDLDKMEQKDEENDWDLTLFTCTLGGSFRVTVRCTAMEES